MRRIRCRPISCRRAFRTSRSTIPVARYWKAMTSGGSTGRPKVILDHQPAVIDTAGRAALGMPLGASLLNPGPLYHNAPFIVSHTALFAGGRVTGLVKFDAEECLRLIEANRVQWVNFVPTMMHRIWALPDAGAQPLRPVEPADRVSHGSADAAMAEGKMDRVARARADLGTLWRHRSPGRHDHIGRRMARTHAARSARSARPRACASSARTATRSRPARPAKSISCPMTAPARTYHYLGAEPKRRADGWESLGDIGQAGCRGLSLSRRPARRHDLARRRQHLSGRSRGRGDAHPEVRSCVVVGLPDPEFGQRVHAILELDPGADAQAVADGMGDVPGRPAQPLQASGKFRGRQRRPARRFRQGSPTLLRDERAGWLKQNRAFRIMPSAHGRKWNDQEGAG